MKPSDLGTFKDMLFFFFANISYVLPDNLANSTRPLLLKPVSFF